MKLTTKRNRWYFWRELFSYMIPIILIVGTIDVFVSFMKCSIHPEWSAPCSINRIFAVIYGVLLIITITFAIISAKKLSKIKKQIENEFFEATKTRDIDENNEEIEEKSKIEQDDIKSEKKHTKKKFEFHKKDAKIS